MPPDRLAEIKANLHLREDDTSIFHLSTDRPNMIDHFSFRAVFCAEDKALVGATSQTSAYRHTNLRQSL
jgi:hypothetical protein